MSARSFMLAASAAAALLPALASAAAPDIKVDFEDAGFGLLPGRTPAYEPAPGVTFGGSAFAAIDADYPGEGFPGSGNFARAPSPIGALTFYGNVDPNAPDAVQPAIINYAKGFNVDVTFSFSTINVGAYVEVWSGENGTGTLLARTAPTDVPALGSDVPPFQHTDPDYMDYGAYNRWGTFTLAFSGIGKSIVLGGSPVLPPVSGYVVGDVFFDDVIFSAVPEPHSVGLMLAGLGVVAFAAARRRG